MCEDNTKQGESFTSAPKIIFEVISKSTAAHDYKELHAFWEAW